MEYKALHQYFIPQDAVDMVSFEQIKPQARNYIMYLRMTQRIPICLVPWDTDSAYHTFITHKMNTDPETKLPLHAGFKERIILYKKATDYFGNEFEPDSEVMERLFCSFLQVQALEEHEMLYLRAYLHVDNSKAIHEFEATGLLIRPLVEQTLMEKGNGSWTLRRTSLEDSRLIKSKCLSFHRGTIHHILIFHVVGLGYYVSDINRGAKLPDMNDPGPIPEYTTVYPCFMDLLQELYKLYELGFYIQK
jgi:hypothetical protein